MSNFLRVWIIGVEAETMNDISSMRKALEIAHGEKLAKHDPERVWGWGTPAGLVRVRRRAELIAQGAGLGPGVRALEVGCGTGLFTERFAETGVYLIAIDLSSDLLEKARVRGLPPDRVRFLEKSFEECEVEGPFDAIIGSSILHHLDIETALIKIYSLLKPGGWISFAEPNMLNPQIMIQKNIPWIKRRMGESPEETALFRWKLKCLLLRVGFEHLEVRPFDWLHPETPAFLIGIVSKIGRYLERIPLVKEFSGSLYIRCRRPLDRFGNDKVNSEGMESL